MSSAIISFGSFYLTSFSFDNNGPYLVSMQDSQRSEWILKRSWWGRYNFKSEDPKHQRTLCCQSGKWVVENNQLSSAFLLFSSSVGEYYWLPTFPMPAPLSQRFNGEALYLLSIVFSFVKFKKKMSIQISIQTIITQAQRDRRLYVTFVLLH